MILLTSSMCEIAGSPFSIPLSVCSSAIHSPLLASKSTRSLEVTVDPQLTELLSDMVCLFVCFYSVLERKKPSDVSVLNIIPIGINVFCFHVICQPVTVGILCFRVSNEFKDSSFPSTR